MLVDYVVPPDVAGALELRGSGCTVLAGGTDLYSQHVGRAMPDRIVDIGGLSGLRGIAETPDGYRIGALTRWTDVAAASLPPCLDGLRAAAAEVGSVQVGEPGHLLEPGDVIHVSPDEWHFHRGSRAAPMVHVAVTGGSVEWASP